MFEPNACGNVNLYLPIEFFYRKALSFMATLFYFFSMEKMKDIPIELILSGKPLNILRKVNIYTLNDLLNADLQKIINIKHVGEKTFNKIEKTILNFKNGVLKINIFMNNRDEKILLMRFCDKRTLQYIGNYFNLTRERVRQICNKYYFIFKKVFYDVDIDKIDIEKDINYLYNIFVEKKMFCSGITLQQFRTILYVLVNYKKMCRSK